MKKRYSAIALLMMLALAFTTASASDAYTYDSASATTITLTGDTATVDGDGATADGGLITIDAAGTYIVSSTLDDGQIHIAATKDDDVYLVLSGANITSSTTAAIYASQAGKLILILADGTENTVTDAVSYVYAGGEDEPDAAIFAKDDLSIGGIGSLTVNGQYRNGIGTKDDLVIDGGTLTITAVNDGLRGRDSITVNGGSVAIQAGNDGIKSNNDGDAEKGWVLLTGGSLDIAAAYDGVQAETTLTVTGGTLGIVSGGGSTNAAPRAQQGFGRGMMAQTQTVETGAESDSMKGIKAGTDLVIEGGVITIDAADDSVHANGNVTISGGALTLATGDDGVHADVALTITGGTILITESYEGLEGATVAISGGDITLTASDDGINAAGGSDGDSGFDTFRMGGSDAYWIDISGGTIVVDAEGDGLDSNGNLTISGGDVTVHGPVRGGNGALDADGSISVTGGTLAEAGSSQMAEVPGSASTQASVAIYYTQTQPAGTVVTLTDSAGNMLASYTAKKEIQTVLFSAPGLTEGAAYTIETNGSAATVTLSGVMTAINESGASVNTFGGFGGGGGGRQGGGGGRGAMTPPDGTAPGTPPDGGAAPSQP